MKMDYEDICDPDDLYKYLTGDVEYIPDVVALLKRSTSYSTMYCEQILAENNFNFLKAYEKIIENKFKLTLSN